MRNNCSHDCADKVGGLKSKGVTTRFINGEDGTLNVLFWLYFRKFERRVELNKRGTGDEQPNVSPEADGLSISLPR